MRKSRSYPVAVAVLQCAILTGLVVIVFNPETLLAQASTSTSARAHFFRLHGNQVPGRNSDCSPWTKRPR
jgi:hypothetical protein